MRFVEIANCAQIAYLTERRAEIAANRLGFSYDVIGCPQTFCWIGKKDDRAVVAIRGSVFGNAPMRNIYDNLDNEFVPWGRLGMVHSGYHQAFSRIQDDVCKSIKGCKSVTFTGHSKGGAIALLAGVMFNGDRIVSFASPKVVNTTFKNSLVNTTRIFRFENRYDLLTKYPYSGVVKKSEKKITERYVHVGRRIPLASFGHSMESYLQGVKEKTGIK
ncbi:MAG: lipase family protein [Sneathiella sp.]